MDELLRYDSEDEQGSSDINSDVVTGSQSSSVPRTPRSSTSDSVPSFDFDTDVDYLSTESEYEPDNDEAEVISSLEDDLRQWATEHKVTHRALNGLLSTLRKQGHVLPVDCRTLLATPQQNTTEPKCGGHYKYYGLEKGICRYLSLMDNNDVHLTVNIDGIPPHSMQGAISWYFFWWLRTLCLTTVLLLWSSSISQTQNMREKPTDLLLKFI